MRFATVETSISAWISHPPEEQTHPARHLLNSVNKRAIDFYFDRRGGRGSQRTASQHRHGSRGGRFRSFFFNPDERFVKKIVGVGGIRRGPRAELIEIGGALWV